MPEIYPDQSFVVRDNENAIARALASGDFVQAYLIVHALIESLLRIFLDNYEEDTTFHVLIESYKRFLDAGEYPEPTFVKELIDFNRRRNWIVHQLWRKGFSFTNGQAESAARAAVTMYGLFIEWLETFDPTITSRGFRYDEGV